MIYYNETFKILYASNSVDLYLYLQVHAVQEDGHGLLKKLFGYTHNFNLLLKCVKS